MFKCMIYWKEWKDWLLYDQTYTSIRSSCYLCKYGMHDLLKKTWRWYRRSLILVTQKGSALILDTCTMQIINTQTLVTIMPDNAHDQKCTLQHTSYQICDPCCPIGTRPNSKWVYKKSRAYVMIVLGIMGATRIHNSVSLLPKTYQVSVTTS